MFYISFCDDSNKCFSMTKLYKIKYNAWLIIIGKLLNDLSKYKYKQNVLNLIEKLLCYKNKTK